MKKLVLLINLMFMPIICFAQDFKIEGDDFTLSQVVDVPNKTKDEIYKGIKLYLNESSKKTKNFIDVDDSSLGMISYNERTAEYVISEFFSAYAVYKVTIDIKDNKFRYTINNFKVNQLFPYTTKPLELNYQQFVAIKNKANTISELEQKIAAETKDRKKEELKKELASALLEKELAESALVKMQNSIKGNVDLYIKSINKTTEDW